MNAKWIDVKFELPKRFGRYLVILKSGARSQYSKTWGGMGEPEIAIWGELSSYTGGPIKKCWIARGSLTVSHWMPLPEFHLKWHPGKDGEEGRFFL